MAGNGWQWLVHCSMSLGISSLWLGIVFLSMQIDLLNDIETVFSFTMWPVLQTSMQMHCVQIACVL
jgi:hypothetical protein